MKTTIVRDFSSPDDYFLCRCNIEESSKAAENREEPKPICSLELYTKGLHLRLPFYNATRWEKIRAALTRIVTAGPALTFEEFTNLFGSYINYQPDLSALAMLIDSGWRGGTLLTELLPEIARLALDLPNRIRQPIRLLRAGENGSLTLSQRQAASLLACAFFCTFPGGEERANYNRINFTKIFHKKTHRAVEKLKCVLHYFSEFVRTSRLAPKVGTISIIRQQFPAEAVLVWAELDAIPLSKLTALPTGKIEDQGPGMTQMDFANKFIGGGVLGHGAVQEEIRFLICPELLISCLVCEKVKRDEAILLIGADRYSDYEGYARTFRWKPRRWEEPDQRDPLGHSTNSGEVLAIDALHYAQLDVQFERRAVDRELLKALAGFSLRTTNSPEPIATGNWGCGAFGGELHLKSLIQLIAASVVGRPLFYFTFDDQTFAQELDESVKLMEDKGVTIGRLYRLIIQYGKEELVRPRCLLGWIRQQLTVNSKDDVPM